MIKESLNRPPTALVTGASRGIGEAIAEQLSTEGWDLILTCSKSIEDLEAVGRRLRAIEAGGTDAGRASSPEADRFNRIGRPTQPDPPKAPDTENAGQPQDKTYTVEVPPEPESRNIRCVRCDMGDPKDVRALFREIDRLDLVVNNAGISYIGLLQDMNDEQWRRILDVNLSSVFYTSRAAIPIFLRQGTGRIINISSVWGNVGASCEAAYSASKGGVNALTKALAKELAPNGIPVNAIACGCVDTAMNGQLKEADRSELCEDIPAGRFASPQEIARAVVLLARMPAYLTGQIITMDGGWT